MDEAVRQLRALPDPVDRARRATTLMAAHQAAVNELSRIRREAVDELRQRGMSQSQIGAALGLTRGRIGQLATSGPAPERALLGDDDLVVVVGQKREAGRDRPVIAQETVIAVNRVHRLAASYGLATEMETVPPPGVVDLNRDNLVILCGPRLFPLVGQILESDPALRFRRDTEGWYIDSMTEETIYRSPTDSGQPRDFGYIGRHSRPDGRGTFLVIGGVHATGTQGGVAYLEHHLGEVYSEVRDRRFSLLIEATYDPRTFTVTDTRSVTPIHKWS